LFGCYSTEFHNAVKEMYNWHDVAERTEKVYETIMNRDNLPLFDRLRKYFIAHKPPDTQIEIDSNLSSSIGIMNVDHGQGNCFVLLLQ
jgi:hypothetical protein